MHEGREACAAAIARRAIAGSSEPAETSTQSKGEVFGPRRGSRKVSNRLRPRRSEKM